MFDIAALEAAGFQKTMTTKEWEDFDSLQRAQRGPNVNIRNDYVLERGTIRISTEQNSQSQAALGVPTTVHHPEIAIIESAVSFARVTCDASNTELILTLVEQVQDTEVPNAGRPYDYNERNRRNG